MLQYKVGVPNQVSIHMIIQGFPSSILQLHPLLGVIII